MDHPNIFKVIEENPFHPANQGLRPWPGRMLDRIGSWWRSCVAKRARWFWAARPPFKVRISVNDREYVLRAEFPHTACDTWQVALKARTLSLRAKTEVRLQPAETPPIQFEPAYDLIERVFHLPPDADPEKAAAEWSARGLCVRLPRKTAVRIIPVLPAKGNRDFEGKLDDHSTKSYP